MLPTVDVLGINVKLFGVMFALGFLACGLVLARRLRELGRPVDWAYEMVFAALIGGLVGARVYFLVQPTPIYETVAMCLLAWLLWRLRDRVRPGVIFALYLVLSGVERLLVEFIRRNREVVAGLTAPQLESIGLMVIGGVALIWMVRRWGGVDGLRRDSLISGPAPAV